MTTATLPLEQVSQRIAQQETELAALRREYATRKTQLGELTRRQQQLQNQLNQVESQIHALTTGSAPVAVAPNMPTPEAKPQKAYTYATLPDLIVPLLRDAKGKPLTTRQLTDAVMQRGFTTASRNPYGVVKSRANELVKKGILRRAPSGAGFLLANVKPESASVRTSTSTPGKSTVAPKANAPQEQPSLRVVLTSLLKKSSKPITGGELARQALAAGYRSSSKDFSHVVHVALTKIDGLENVSGQGYRLKKR